MNLESVHLKFHQHFNLEPVFIANFRAENVPNVSRLYTVNLIKLSWDQSDPNKRSIISNNII